jgi:hypothetical protein
MSSPTHKRYATDFGHKPKQFNRLALRWLFINFPQIAAKSQDLHSLDIFCHVTSVILTCNANCEMR